MRVSLRQPRGSDPAPPAAGVAFLDARGPFRLLGGADGAEGGNAAGVQPLAAGADTLFGPRGAALGPPGARLAVCDTGHHRLLLWRALPRRDAAPADLVVGQPDFASEGRNARGRPGPATFNVPTGVAVERDLLVVADAWNHRVLIWHRLPERSNAPADVVLGQADFASVEANRGHSVPGADTLHWCYGVALAGTRLVVADTGNRRVLLWNSVPTANGQPADLVLGQPDFRCRDENAGGSAAPLGMRWPHAAAAAGGGLQVADAGNSRILIWRRWPRENAALPGLVLGQPDFASLEHNGGRYWPDAATLNMPYGLTAGGDWLVVADTANSRLLAWPLAAIPAGAAAAAGAPLASGAAATGLAAQDDFGAKGDNRWQAPARDSLCWPTAVAARDGILAVADSGNHRVSLWKLTRGPGPRSGSARGRADDHHHQHHHGDAVGRHQRHEENE
jgi:hypothetical protein